MRMFVFMHSARAHPSIDAVGKYVCTDRLPILRAEAILFLHLTECNYFKLHDDYIIDNNTYTHTHCFAVSLPKGRPIT